MSLASEARLTANQTRDLACNCAATAASFRRGPVGPAGHDGLAPPGQMWLKELGVVVIAVRRHLLPLAWVGAVLLAAALVVLTRTIDAQAAPAPGEVAPPPASVASQSPLEGDSLRQPHLSPISAPATRLSSPPTPSNRLVTTAVASAEPSQEPADDSAPVNPASLASAVGRLAGAGELLAPGAAGGWKPTVLISDQVATQGLIGTMNSVVARAEVTTFGARQLTPVLDPVPTPVVGLLGAAVGVVIPVLPPPLNQFLPRGLGPPEQLLAGPGQAGSARAPTGSVLSGGVGSIVSTHPNAIWRGQGVQMERGPAPVRSITGGFGGGSLLPLSGTVAGAGPPAGPGLALLPGVPAVGAQVLRSSRHPIGNDRLQPVHLISLIERPG